jgi:hypothetical protein
MFSRFYLKSLTVSFVFVFRYIRLGNLVFWY